MKTIGAGIIAIGWIAFLVGVLMHCNARGAEPFSYVFAFAFWGIVTGLVVFTYPEDERGNDENRK